MERILVDIYGALGLIVLTGITLFLLAPDALSSKEGKSKNE